MVFTIAIIGAGPAGCLLARLLSLSSHNFKITLFESESSLDFRSQGGTLDLHEKTGQSGLKAAGLYDEFRNYARYDGEAIKIADKNLLCYVQQGASSTKSTTGRPEIDRPQLRKILFESLPEGIVRWSHRLLRVDKDLTLHFTNQPSQRGFDLVVGADGAWSKVRSALSDTQPFYSGISGHAFRIPDAEEREPELYSLVNRGSLFSFSDSKSIMAQYMSDGSINISTWSVRPRDWQQQSLYDVHDSKAVKEACLRDYSEWDPRLVAFTQKAEDVVVPRDLYMLPIGFSWEHVAGLTVIGDAKNLMTPFAGEGVNLAFEDCVKLSEAIVKAAESIQSSEEISHHHQILDTQIRAFEQNAFKRTQATQQLTYDMMHAMFFVPGAPRNGIEQYLIRAIEGELGPLLTKLVTPVVYIWFFIFKLVW